jgi:NDP-sugar pyrophosphorylase family protein
MRPLTDRLPKALAPYRGSTLIGQSLDSLRHQVDRIHVTVGYKSAMLAEYLMTASVDSVLNTSGRANSWWIHNTLMRHLDEPVLVLTCDNVTELDVAFLSTEYERIGRPAGMIVPVRPIEGVDGDFVEVSEGRVLAIGRGLRSDLYASGIQVLNPFRTAGLCPDGGDFYSVWQALVQAGELGCSALYPLPWFSIDTLEHLVRTR